MPMRTSESFAEEVEDRLHDSLRFDDTRLDNLGGGLESVETYEEAELSTSCRGLKLNFRDGSVALLTIKAAAREE